MNVLSPFRPLFYALTGLREKALLFPSMLLLLLYVFARVPKYLICHDEGADPCTNNPSLLIVSIRALSRIAFDQFSENTRFEFRLNALFFNHIFSIVDNGLGTQPPPDGLH